MSRPENARCIVYDNLDEYNSAVVPFLEENEVENGMLLAALNEAKPAALMARIERGGKNVAAAFYRDRALIVTSGVAPESEILASTLIENGMDIPALLGPPDDAERFATVWAVRRGCSSRLIFNHGIYRLTRVVWPSGVPGSVRLMAESDIEIVAEWIVGFHRDALPDEPVSSDEARKNAADRIPRRMTFVWEVDRTLTAMAALARPTRRGIWVNAVYTPPEFRRRGYASALVAAVSHEGLNRGKQFCALYTDLTNPTSNSIYTKIGYERFSSSKYFRFGY